MQGIGSALVFPRLTFHGTVPIRKQKLPVYALEWVKFDDAIDQR